MLQKGALIHWSVELWDISLPCGCSGWWMPYFSSVSWIGHAIWFPMEAHWCSKCVLCDLLFPCLSSVQQSVLAINWLTEIWICSIVLMSTTLVSACCKYSLAEASCSGIEVGLEEMRHGLELVSVFWASKLIFQALKGLGLGISLSNALGQPNRLAKKVILLRLVSEDANRP